MGIVMTMSSETIIDWAFQRIKEHGVMLESINSIKTAIDLLQAPLNRQIINTLEDKFDKLRNIILTHSMEEDTKLPALLAQNMNVAMCIKKLKKDWRYRSIDP